MLKKNLVGNQFGAKVKELFKLIEDTPNWSEYVSDNTKKIVETLYETKRMDETLKILDLKYTTVRAHLVRAINRIKNEKRDHLRNAKSKRAQQLLELTEMVPDWERCLTDQETILTNKFKELKNFYKVARELNLKPGNIAVTLYGNHRKLGVIGKIQKLLPCASRYD